MAETQLVGVVLPLERYIYAQHTKVNLLTTILWLFTLNYIVPHTTMTTDLWCHNHAHLNLKFKW